jgi:hypothetical protein
MAPHVFPLAALMLGLSGFLSAQPVSLVVRFKLTDLDYKPLAGVPVRLVVASDPAWQKPGSGRQVVTDAKGEAEAVLEASLDKSLRKAPSNFVANLLSLPKQTLDLRIAVELVYDGRPGLYAVDIHRFPNGDCMRQGFRVFTADAGGAFTQGGTLVDGAGFTPWDYMLAPDPDDPAGRRWTVKLAFKKQPPPVRR